MRVVRDSRFVRRLVLLASIATVGCRRSTSGADAGARASGDDADARRADASAPISPAAASDVGASINEEPVSFRWGKVHLSIGELRVRLSNQPLSCELDPEADDGAYLPKGRIELVVTILPGPGGTYFEGTTAGARVSVFAHDMPVARGKTFPTATYGGEIKVPPAFARIGVDAVGRAKGERLRGKIDVAWTDPGPIGNVIWARGAFDAEVCDDVPKVEVPSAPSTEPIALREGDAVVAPKDAIAWVEKLGRDGDAIEEIDLFAERVTQCKADAGAPKPIATLSTIGGASRAQPSIGRPQQTLAWVHTKPGIHVWPGWVVFDTLRFEPGGTVRGRVFAREQSVGADHVRSEIDGAFAARVCRR